MLRIGLLTSGGDCQALNATMRGVVKGLANNVKDLEVYGFMNGYKGLIYSDYRMLSAKDFSGILTQGGTIFCTKKGSLWFRLPWIFFFMRAALRTLTMNVTPTAYLAQAPSRHTGDSGALYPQSATAGVMPIRGLFHCEAAFYK